MNAVPLQAQSHKKSGNLIHGMKDAVNPRFHCSVMVLSLIHILSVKPIDCFYRAIGNTDKSVRHAARWAMRCGADGKKRHSILRQSFVTESHRAVGVWELFCTFAKQFANAPATPGNCKQESNAKNETEIWQTKRLFFRWSA